MRETNHSSLAEERALLDAWRAGDPGVLEALYCRYSRSVLRFLVTKVRNDEEAEDLLHDTFVTLRGVRAPSRDGATFRLGTFILGVARNVFFNHLRARGRRARRELDFGAVSLCELDAGLSSIVCAGQQAGALLEALREIPVEDQLLLELKYFEDLSNDEIAAVLETNAATIPRRTARAKHRLQERLAARLRIGLDDVQQKVERWTGEALSELRRERRELWP